MIDFLGLFDGFMSFFSLTKDSSTKIDNGNNRCGNCKKNNYKKPTYEAKTIDKKQKNDLLEKQKNARIKREMDIVKRKADFYSTKQPNMTIKDNVVTYDFKN
ncbi:hypothetical protein [Desulfotalea psychrophila]|uniref:Uncharacterized protein n=1 Tax=Desulfotalea psychrophila (strain LSv54 / DSM 12343) TaxID=177439 RepID=Q6AI70_DESPS|nr:hypothetical protein [Desulfotalea psychrophila]CAG37859.1 unknown protein [Desulfotalea psychrophila LSv54]